MLPIPDSGAWRPTAQAFEQELPLAMLDPPGVSQIEANLHLAQLHTDLLEYDEGIKCVPNKQRCALVAGS